MKTRVKAIALLLAVILIFSSGLGGSSMIPVSDAPLPTVPPETTVPTTQAPTEPSTEATTIPTTQAPTEPATVPTTEPTTVPTTVPPETSEPTEPVPPPTTLPEPWSSTNITIGTEVPGISAKKAFVYDCESGDFLYMKSEADAKVYPASITKLMTAYVALQYLEPDTILTMDSDVLSIVPSDTSKAGLFSGDRFAVAMVLKAMLIPSGADAAHLLAVSAGRVIAGNPKLSAQKAEDVFVTEMNRQAASMALVNTHFVNCDGYPDYYHYTCMADLAVIATACLGTPLIRDTVCCASATLYYADGRSKTIYSTNSLLKSSSSYYRAEARGMKTGTTDTAGACLLSAFWVNGRYMLVGVFQCASNASRYANAVTLFDTYANALPPETEPEPTVPPETEPEPTVPPETTEPTTAPPETTEPPTETSETTEPTTAPPETTEPTTVPPEATVPPTEAPEEDITAKNAFVWDTAGSTFQYLKGDPSTRLYPASITKLYTAYAGLKYLEPSREVTVGDILDTMPKDASKAGLSKGDTLTVQNLLEGMLLPSGSDAALVLAVEAGRVIAEDPALPETEALAMFMEKMNEQAAADGLTGTHFVNPDGYHDPDHYSCMTDIVKIGTLALSSPLIRQLAATSSVADPTSENGAVWRNSNLLINPASSYYRSNAIGLKTGNTDAAGACLLSAFEIDGRIVLIGVFGCPDSMSRFDDTLMLCDEYCT